MNCEKVDIYNIDLELVNHLEKMGGWNYLKEKYNNESQSGRNHIKHNEIQYKTYLEFMGAFRKIIIEIIVKKTINKISNDKKHKNKYKSFVKNGKFNQYIRVSAFGSKNLTSDYDVTFAGPSSYLLIKCILENFKTINAKKKQSISNIFDSNLYIMPVFIVNKNNINRFKKHNIDLFKVDCMQMIPIPNRKHIINLEFNQLKKKKNDNRKLTNANIAARYKQIVELGAELDTFVYKDNYENSTIKNNMNFWSKIHKIREYEIDAYYCFSTVLLIVYGIQLKKIDQIEKVLVADNFLIAAVENMIDLYKHHKISFKNNKLSNRNLAVTLSKYIQRIFFNLDYYLKKSPINKKKVMKYFKRNKVNYIAIKKLTDEIIHYRKNFETYSFSEKNAFTPKIDKFIKTFKLNKPLKFGKKNIIFNLFKNLDEKLSFLFVPNKGVRHITRNNKRIHNKRAKVTKKAKNAFCAPPPLTRKTR
jgi:hypothetical protein